MAYIEYGLKSDANVLFIEGQIKTTCLRGMLEHKQTFQVLVCGWIGFLLSRGATVKQSFCGDAIKAGIGQWWRLSATTLRACDVSAVLSMKG